MNRTLTDILQAFNKKYAKEDIWDMSRYKFDQLRYDPSTESFTDLLTKFTNTAKQAYGGDRASDISETFLFAKLPIQIQNELAMAGKHDAIVEEIKTFVQRRCRYAQLLPGTSGMQPLNQVFNYQAKPHTSGMQPWIKCSTTRPNHKLLNRLPTTTTSVRQTLPRRSNESSKETADTVTFSAISAVNVSETKPMGSTLKPNNVPIQKITIVNNNPTIRDTTRSWCAKSAQSKVEVKQKSV